MSQKLNRFILFGGDHYDNGGGWDHFLGSFESKEAAMKAGDEVTEQTPNRFKHQWAEVVDIEEGGVIATRVNDRVDAGKWMVREKSIAA